MDSIPMLEPADVFLTRGSSLMSRLIRILTRGFGEPRTRVNHVGLVVQAGTPSEAVVVEALRKVVRHPLKERYGKGSPHQVAVFRALNLDGDEKHQVVEKALGYVGRKYGWFKVVAHMLDWFLLGAYVFRRLTKDDRYPICSWLVAHAFLAVGKTFGVAPGMASPDDIWDFVTGKPNRYQEIIPLGSLDEYM